MAHGSTPGRTTLGNKFSNLVLVQMFSVAPRSSVPLSTGVSLVGDHFFGNHE